jgi:hypothetical protein
MASLLSVNVGLPRDIAWQGKTVHTAVWKAPVQDRRMVRRLNIDGDGQGDLAGLLVARRSRESSNVTSLILEPADGPPLQAALPGQFIVLRLKPSPDAPTLLRSYSLSGEPSADPYQISVKRERMAQPRLTSTRRSGSVTCSRRARRGAISHSGRAADPSFC